MTLVPNPEYDPQLVADVDSVFTAEDEREMTIRADIVAFVAQFLERGDR